MFRVTLIDKSGKEVEPRVYPNGLNQFEIAKDVVNRATLHEAVIVPMGAGTGKTILTILALGDIIELDTVRNALDGRHRAVLIEPINAIGEQIRNDFSHKFTLVSRSRQLAYRVSTIFGKNRYHCLIDPSVTADRARCSVGTLTRRIKSCPHYTPAVTSEMYSRLGSNIPVATSYLCVTGTCYILGAQSQCPYYAALHEAYISAPIIVTNPLKYMYEVNIGIMPEHAAIALDEGDMALKQMRPIYSISEQEVIEIVKKLRLFNNMEVNIDEMRRSFSGSMDSAELLAVHMSFWNRVRQVVLEDIRACVDGCKDDDCALSCMMARYDLLLDITNRLNLLSKITSGIYTIAGRPGNREIVLFPRNMGQIFEQIFRNRYIIIVSATPPTDSEMRIIYGINRFTRTDGWYKLLGPVYVGTAGVMTAARSEIDVNRADYAELLIKNIELALHWKPVLIHVVAWDIWEDPMIMQGLAELGITEDYIDRDGSKILQFRQGKLPVVITSRATRGIDLPHNAVRAIVIPKAPYPDLSSPETKFYERVFTTGEFRHWYEMQARYNVYQMIARGIRDYNDWVVVFTPDIRIIQLIMRLQHGGFFDAVYGMAPILDKSILGRDDIEVVEGQYVKFKIWDRVAQALNIIKVQENSEEKVSAVPESTEVGKNVG